MLKLIKFMLIFIIYFIKCINLKFLSFILFYRNTNFFICIPIMLLLDFNSSFKNGISFIDSNYSLLKHFRIY